MRPSTTLLDRLSFPLLEEIAAVGWVKEAVHVAATHRTGVLVVGRKGAGKSIALERAESEFVAGEDQRRAADAGYERRAIRVVPPIYADDRSSLVRALYKAEMGALPPRLSRGGDAVILDDLVEAWLDSSVAVVAFDEADGLSTGALAVCRDMMALSTAKRRRVSTDGGSFRASGIGVVLLGTPDLHDRLRPSPEYGERWSRVIEVAGVPDAVLPEVYRRYLPCFAAEAEARGEEAWSAFVQEVVPQVVQGSARRVEQHVRAYVMLAANASEVPLEEIEDVPFDETLFLGALNERPRGVEA